MLAETSQSMAQVPIMDYKVQLLDWAEKCAREKPLLQKNSAFKRFTLELKKAVSLAAPVVDVVIIYCDELSEALEAETIELEQTLFEITRLNYKNIHQRAGYLDRVCIQILVKDPKMSNVLFDQAFTKDLPRPLIRKSVGDVNNLTETLQKVLLEYQIGLNGMPNGHEPGKELDEQLLKFLENWQLAQAMTLAYEGFTSSFGGQATDKSRAFGKPSHIAMLSSEFSELRTALRNLEQQAKQEFEEEWRSQQFDERIKQCLETELKELLGFDRKKVGSAYRLIIPDLELARIKKALVKSLSGTKAFIDEEAKEWQKASTNLVNQWLMDKQLEPLVNLPAWPADVLNDLETRLKNLEVEYEGRVMDKGVSQFVSSVRKPFMLILIMGSMFGFSLSTLKNSEYFFMVLIVLLFVGVYSAINAQSNDHIDMIGKELKNARMAIERAALQHVIQGLNLLKSKLLRHVSQVSEAGMNQAEKQAKELELELLTLHDELGEIARIKETCSLQRDNPLSRLMTKNRR